MKIEFEDKNPKKNFEISTYFEDLSENPEQIKQTLIYVCKKYRILPKNVGVKSKLVLDSPCGLCLKQQQYRCKIRTLSCNHTFHDRCITNWLIENKLECKICKQFSFHIT